MNTLQSIGVGVILLYVIGIFFISLGGGIESLGWTIFGIIPIVLFITLFIYMLMYGPMINTWDKTKDEP